MSAYLTLENISKYYTAGQSVVMGLNSVSLSFSIGEFVAVTGESGSGKSTLAKVLAGILPYEGGEMYVNGNPTSHYGHLEWEQYRVNRVSFISQNYDILPGCSVLENVVSALILAGIEKGKAVSEAEDILKQVELSDQKKRKAAKLSSGQKQRLSIARALAKPAPILIADEPTGNLDGENSEKIIRMLAAAAKERLVIMITHDYDEVEELVSRHITVRDGVIDSDAVLRPAEGSVSHGSPEKKIFKNLSWYITGLQAASRPVWSAIMLLFFMLTAVSLFVFLGTFTVNLDDSSTRYYDDSVFADGSKDRIVVAKSDLSEMTSEELERLLEVPHVSSAERYGFLSDIQYHYRENIDYQLHYIAVTDENGNPTGFVRRELTLEDSDLFLETIPWLPQGSSFLTAGRLPENMYEVVAAGDESLIGTTFPVYIRDRKNWQVDAYILFDATVVGVTDMAGPLYFDRQLGRVLIEEYAGNQNIIAPDYTLSDNTRLKFSAAMYNSVFNSIVQQIRQLTGGLDYDKAEKRLHETEFHFPVYGDPDAEIVLKPDAATHISTLANYILTAPEVFEKIVADDIYGNVISLTIADYAYTDRVLEAVQSLGYHAVSPYRLGTTRQDETLAAERLQTLKICILAALAVFLLQVLALRAMFGMEIGEYKLLANLGLRRRTAIWSVVWQMLVFTGCGQLLASAVISCACYMGVERVYNIVKYLPVPYIVMFMLVHLAAGLLASLWVQAAVDRQVYPLNLQNSDLEMDDEEA